VSRVVTVRRAVLLAHPAGHSLSPPMHDAAFAASGVSARYQAWDVPPRQLGAAVQRLRHADVLGANVTVPHKQAVMAHLDSLSPAATEIGAVNVVSRRGEKLHGDNSDATGFLRSLREAGVDPAGRRVALLGAGGAACAVAWSLLQANVASLWIVNRSEGRAIELRRRAARWTDGAELEASCDPADAVGADLWINATSVGMRRDGHDPDESPLDAALLSAAATAAATCERVVVAMDLVYRPRRTRLLRDAEAAGMRTIDGSGMLLHQGAVAFETWTGVAAPLQVMREALEAALRGEEMA